MLQLLQRATVAVLLAGAAVAAGASTNLVTNGSFEAPNIVGGGYVLYGHGSTAITGWTVVAPGDYIQLTPDTFLGLKASEGRQWIDLTGIYGYDKGLRSDSFATVVGQHYTVSFDVGDLLWPGFGNSTVGLSINGGAEQLFVNSSTATTAHYPMNWQHFSVDYVATSAATSLAFFGRANGALSNNAGIGLDNISVSVAVSAVPEPETYALMLLGLGMLGWRGQRRSILRRGSVGAVSLALTAAATAAPVISPYADDLPSANYSTNRQYSGGMVESVFNGGYWNAGAHGTYWIQADMGATYTLSEVKLTVDVTPYTNTTQWVYLSDHPIGDSFASLIPVASRTGYTVQYQQFDLTFAPASGRYLEIVSYGGASWTALGDGGPVTKWIDPVSLTPAVPEPETYALLLAGLGVVAGVARRQRRPAA